MTDINAAPLAPSERSPMSANRRMTRGACVPLAVVLFLLALTGGVAAAAGSRDRAVRAGFARLQRDVARTRVSVLPARGRRQLLRSVTSAAAVFDRGGVCRALRRVDGLRQTLRPRRARRADASVVRLDRLLMRFRASRSCAKRTRTAVLEAMPAGQVPPRPQGNPEIEQAEFSPRLRRGHFRPFGRRSPPVRTREAPAAEGCGSGQCRRLSAFAAGVDDPLRYLRNEPIGVALRFGYPAEVQAASARGVVWATGNESAAYSIDGGAHFQFLEPRTVFNDASDGGVDGDQVVTYAPQINRFIWLMQYRCVPVDCLAPGVKHNRYGLAMASPEAIRVNPAGAWREQGPWDITSALLKQPTRWFDFPTIQVSGTSTPSSSLYLTWTVADAGGVSVLGRINLAGLAAGAPVMQWFTDANDQVRPVQNTRGRAFFVRHVDASLLRIWAWDEASRLAFPTDVAHSTIPTADWASKTQAGFDWLQARKVYWKPLGATLRKGELWVSWGGGRRYTDGGKVIFPQPHIEIAKFDANTLKRTGERQIGNPDEAYAYPSLATNSEGDVAIGYSYGGGSTPSASPAVGLLTGREGLFRVWPNDPTGGQGDYTGVQVDFPDTTRFSEGSFVKEADGKDHWHYTLFGRAP